MLWSMRAFSLAGLLVMSLALSGCLVRAAADVVTAPVRVGAKAVDLATTSQSEADEQRGREMREREERLGRLQRELERQEERCEDGKSSACEEAREIRYEIDELLYPRPE